MDLSAVAVTNDASLSVSGALDKLLRQAQRQRAKRRERKGAASPRLLAPAPERGRDGAPRVVRTRRAAVKPMSLDEAVLELEGSREGVFVFRDASTEGVRVLFRRRDGHLGLIEPEA
jgi:putative sigma-54 modulation protein